MKRYLNSKAKLIGKMREVGIKGLSDKEIERAFERVVARDYCVKATKWLIENGYIASKDVY